MIVSCGKKTIGVGAVCCRPWKCAFERAPEMAGDDICIQYQSSGFRRIYCKIRHALWSTRIENHWLMINHDPYDFRYCGRWSTNCGSIILSTALRLSKIVKKWWSQLVRTARMLASVWHESGIFKLVHWWCTLYIVYRVWQVWGSSDCLFVLFRQAGSLQIDQPRYCTPLSYWVWHVTDKGIQRRTWQNISLKGSPSKCGGKK